MKSKIVTGVVLSLLVGAAAALAQTATIGTPVPRPQSGKEIYDYWCATCHGPGLGNPGQNALPGTAQLALKYRGTDISPLLEERTDLVPEFVKVIVRQGVSYMPQFRKTEINDAELDKLAEYLARNNPALKK